MFYSPTRFERGFAHILLLIILVIGVVIGIYLVQNPQIFNPKASESSDMCKASDPFSFRNCLAAAEQSDAIRQIEVTNQITCSKKEECSFSLLKRNKPLTIFGTPNTGAGFKRINNYDYPLLVFGNIGEENFSKIAEIRDLTVKNLIFDETTAKCDFIEKGIVQCNSPLVLGPKLINPTIDNITILHAKAHGIQIKGTFNLVIKNSKIIDSEGNGIWFDSGLPAGCSVDFNNYQLCPIDINKISTVVKIENNLFAENKIAAVEFYANGYKQFPNRIIGNLFIHNHRDSKYLFCPVAQPEKGIAAGHCPGGQLVIARSKHVYIEENVIRDGKIDAIDPSKGTTYHSQGLLATGIELSDSIENITIKNNKIYNNSGAAIFADYVGEKYKVNNVNIFWNMVYGNGLKFGGQGYPNLEKAPYGFSFINNIGERADIPFREAFIFADPPVCVPETNNGQCASTIQWYTNDYSNVNVRLPDNPELLLASGINNKTNVPWISAIGAKFALEEPLSKKIIDTTYAKAESSVVQSPTSAPATPAPRAKVILKAEPTTCTLNATGLCTIRISWDSSAYRSEIDPVTPLKISVRENPGSVFANSAEGAQDAPWIGINGVTFDVYYKDKLIDSLFVKGVNP